MSITYIHLQVFQTNILLINSAYYFSHATIGFHYHNYINGKINKQTKKTKTWINKLAESLLQSSCYKNPTQCPTSLSSSCFIVIRKFTCIKHGIGNHGVCGHLWPFSSKLHASLCCNGWGEKRRSFIIFVDMQIGSWDPGHKDQMLMSFNSYLNRIQ